MATNGIDAQGWLVQAEADKVSLDYIAQMAIANAVNNGVRADLLVDIGLIVNALNDMEVEVQLFLGNTVTFPAYTPGTTHLFTGVVPVWASSVTYGTAVGLFTAAGDTIAQLKQRYILWTNYIIMANDGSGHTYGGTTAKSANYLTAQTTVNAELLTLGTDAVTLTSA